MVKKVKKTQVRFSIDIVRLKRTLKKPRYGIRAPFDTEEKDESINALIAPQKSFKKTKMHPDGYKGEDPSKP